MHNNVYSFDRDRNVLFDEHVTVRWRYGNPKGIPYMSKFSADVHLLDTIYIHMIAIFFGNSIILE